MLNLGINNLPIVTHCMSLIIKPWNGTFSEGRGEHILSWSERFDIICGVARGLCHLHGLRPQIIHGDIKPQNILLDRTFQAKIADFGTIFSFPDGKTYFTATSPIGTLWVHSFQTVLIPIFWTFMQTIHFLQSRWLHN